MEFLGPIDTKIAVNAAPGGNKTVKYLAFEEPRKCTPNVPLLHYFIGTHKGTCVYARIR